MVISGYYSSNRNGRCLDRFIEWPKAHIRDRDYLSHQVVHLAEYKKILMAGNGTNLPYKAEK